MFNFYGGVLAGCVMRGRKLLWRNHGYCCHHYRGTGVASVMRVRGATEAVIVIRQLKPPLVGRLSGCNCYRDTEAGFVMGAQLL